MAAQGSVVATWRTRGEKRFGPYFSVVFRDGGRPETIYLGPLEEVQTKPARFWPPINARRTPAASARLRRQGGQRCGNARQSCGPLAASSVMRAVAGLQFMRWLGTTRASTAWKGRPTGTQSVQKVRSHAERGHEKCEAAQVAVNSRASATASASAVSWATSWPTDCNSTTLPCPSNTAPWSSAGGGLRRRAATRGVRPRSRDRPR